MQFSVIASVKLRHQRLPFSIFYKLEAIIDLVAERLIGNGSHHCCYHNFYQHLSRSLLYMSGKPN